MKSILKSNAFIPGIGLLILLSGFGCGPGSAQPEPAPAPPVAKKETYKQVPYAYSEDFMLFIHEIGMEKSAWADTTFVIPLNSCEECINKLLGMLSHNCARPYAIILSGKNERIDPESYLKNCSRPAVWDPNSVLNTYRLEITGPAVLLRKGEQTDVIHLNTGNLDAVHEAFGWE